MSTKAGDPHGATVSPRAAGGLSRPNRRRLASRRLWCAGAAGLGTLMLAAYVLPGAFAAPVRAARSLRSAVAGVTARHLTLNGTAANNTFEIDATGPDSGTFTVNDGRAVSFSGIASLTMNGVGGHDVCRIVNPRRSLFAPSGGIFCNGRNAPGRPRRGVLELIGGRAASGSYVPTRPGAGKLTHRLGHIVQTIRFSGLAPITDTTPSASFTFNASPTTNDTIEFVNGPSGELTIESENGDFESVTFANKTSVTINATASGDQAVLNNSQSATGLDSLALNGTSDVMVDRSTLSGVAVSLNSSAGNLTVSGALSSGSSNAVLSANGGSISETGAGAITAAALTTDSGTGATLNGSNSVTTFNATNSTSGNVAFSDPANPLTVSGVSNAGGNASISSGGDINLAGNIVTAAANTLALTAGGAGSITQATNTTLTAANIVLLAGTGSIGSPTAPLTVQGSTLTANAGGNVYVTSIGSGVLAVGPVAAGDNASISSGGDINLGAINLSGSASTATLSASAISGTPSAAVSAPTLIFLLTGSQTQPFTLTPTQLQLGSGGQVPFTTSNLAITFTGGPDNGTVTPSSTTSFSVSGASATNNTLNFIAQGGRPTVTTTGPLSGVINEPGFKPVNFDNFTVVTSKVTVTIGSDLSAAPANAQNCGPCTEGLTAVPNGQIAAPCSGTITGWQVRGYMGTAPANVELRVLHPNGSGQFSGAGTSGPITLGTTDAVHQASTNLPITAGDFIGLDVPNNLTFDLATTTGATEPIFVPPLTDGGSATSPTYNIQNTELLINATVACPGETLSVSQTGTGSGIVTSADGGIDCGATCSDTYLAGTSVVLTATPIGGSSFAGWSGACTGTGPCNLTLNADTSVTATFIAPPVTLSVSKRGTGGGTVTSADGGILCGAMCSRTYASGTAVTLLAHPAAGSTFAGWSGACTGTTPCTLTLSSSLSVTAVFNRVPLPGTKITSAKTSSKHGTATFKFIAIGQASGFQCALVKAPKRHHKAPKPLFASCRSPKRYTRLRPGGYTFLVRAFNAAGADPTPAKKKFTT